MLMPQKPEPMPLSLFGIEVESFCAVKSNKCVSDVQTYMHAQFAECGLLSKVEDLLEMLPAMKYRYLEWLLTTDNSLDIDQACTDFNHRILPDLEGAPADRNPKFAVLNSFLLQYQRQTVIDNTNNANKTDDADEQGNDRHDDVSSASTTPDNATVAEQLPAGSKSSSNSDSEAHRQLAIAGERHHFNERAS